MEGKKILQSDHGKTEALLFTKRRKMKTEVWNTNFFINRQPFKFKGKATPWLSFCLDSAAYSKIQIEMLLQKPRQAEARI